MAARIRLLQMAIAAVNIAIVALAFTSIWPFHHGDFKVDLTSASEVTWSYSDGIVHVTAPYSIDNGGFYDVSDLTLHYAVTNYSGYQLADQTIPIGDIPAGQITSSSIDFRFDLLRMFNDGALGMVFSDDLLRFAVDVSCQYTMKLVKFETSYQVSVPWDALVLGYGIDWNQSNLPDPPAFHHVPPYYLVYWLSTSDLLSGLPPAQVSLTVVGTTSGPSASSSTSIQLGGNYSGTVTFDPTLLVHYSSLDSIRYDVQVAGFRWSGTIPIPEWMR